MENGKDFFKKSYWEQKVKIPVNIGYLEGQISRNKMNNPIACVFFHPHPLYGGTMANNVIRAVYKLCIKSGFSALRFNFRGVGSSDGSYDNGVGELDDGRAAIRYLLHEFPFVKHIYLIGYSFGATIAGALVDEFPEVKGYAAISYPFTFIPELISKASSPKSKFFLMGDKDDFTTVDAFTEHVDMITPPKEVKLFENTDHFWQENDKKMANFIIDWIRRIEMNRL